MWAAARNAHVDEFRAALAHSNFLWLLPYPFVCVALNLIRGEIWRQLLVRRVTSIQAFWAYSIGFLANNVLPFRIGEVVRIVVLSTKAHQPIVEVATAAALERLLDLIALAAIVLVVAPAVGGVPGLFSASLVVVGFVAAALAVILAIGRFQHTLPVFVASWFSRIPSTISDGLSRRWRQFAQGVTVLWSPRIGVPTTLAALLVWFLTVVLQWFVLRAFQPAAGLTDAAFMVAAVSLASALPAAPGFVGVYHWAGQQSLVMAFPQLYDASTALAAATLAHAASYVTSSILGVIGLWYFGLRPSAMRQVLHPSAGRDPVSSSVPVG